jgi:aerobic carbon-monoxide dehydrogenase medium subunit
LKPAPFDYHRPQTIPEALDLLARFGADAKLLAGGQSLGPMMNLRLARPAHLIDINDLLELDFVRPSAGRLEIGALTRHHRLATDRQIAAQCPILSAVAGTIGHYAIRQRGTLGGSLSHADPAAQLPLIATLLDAELHLRSPAAERRVTARDFFVASLVTSLAADEMLVAIRLPVLSSATGWAFESFAQRHGGFAVVAVATTVELGADGRVAHFALALGGIAVVPVAFDGVASRFLAMRPDAAWRAAIAEAVAAEVTPEGEARLSADYRRDLAQTLTERALATAVQHAAKDVAA